MPYSVTGFSKHFAFRFEVPDVNAACERFEKLGVKFVKKPQDGRMKGLAFIKVKLPRVPSVYMWMLTSAA